VRKCWHARAWWRDPTAATALLVTIRTNPPQMPPRAQFIGRDTPTKRSSQGGFFR
jgi:hypothetical protein